MILCEDGSIRNKANDFNCLTAEDSSKAIEFKSCEFGPDGIGYK